MLSSTSRDVTLTSDEPGIGGNLTWPTLPTLVYVSYVIRPEYHLELDQFKNRHLAHHLTIFYP
jgi:hypothetical protein